ncbi:MAG: RNA polymerase sigma factor [Cytophagales bacterium]|nr:RNA polymerase sigma factor [Cytophagales bacterium]
MHPEKIHNASSSPENEKYAGLWNNLRGGDRKALAQIYTQYFNKLYNYGSRITTDVKMVEDSIQDLFIELWNKREKLREVRNVKYYLFKALRRKIILRLTDSKSLCHTVDISSFEMKLSHRSHYINREVTKEIRKKLMHLIESLTPKQKEAIFLIYYDELSFKEVASIMSVEVRTVYNLVHQAMVKLRENKSSLSTFSILPWLI